MLSLLPLFLFVLADEGHIVKFIERKQRTRETKELVRSKTWTRTQNMSCKNWKRYRDGENLIIDHS